MNDLLAIVCGQWFPSIGDGVYVKCSWNGVWDTTLTREQNVRAHGGRYDDPAPDEPWQYCVMMFSPPAPTSEGPPTPRRRERARLPMKAEAPVEET